MLCRLLVWRYSLPFDLVEVTYVLFDLCVTQIKSNFIFTLEPGSLSPMFCPAPGSNPISQP